MNKKLPFTPNETDAILYVIISVLLLMSVNQVLSRPLSKSADRGLMANCWNVSPVEKENPAAVLSMPNYSFKRQTTSGVEQSKSLGFLSFCEAGAFVMPERRSRQLVYSNA